MKVCEVCGRELTGRHRFYCSPQCRQVALGQREKAARAQLGKLPGNHQQPKPKVCADCGSTFYGYPRSYRCPECQAEADRKHNAEHYQRKKAGHARQIGSVSRCERCGAEYIVEGGLQRYCPACAKEIWKEDALRRYHQDKDAINERRRPSRAEVYKKAVESRVRVCEVCGCELNKHQHLYCSMECRRKAEAERKKDPAKAKPQYRRWVLRSPKGEYYKTDNLQAFMNDHPGYFPKPKTAILLLYKNGGTAGWQVVSRETLDGHVDYPTPSRIRKFFRLRSPDGQIYEVTNVRQFLREHPEEFPNVNSAASALSTAQAFRGWTVLPNVDPSAVLSAMSSGQWHDVCAGLYDNAYNRLYYRNRRAKQKKEEPYGQN